MTEKQLGQVRHLLTAGGGVLVALGLASESDAMQMTDLGMTAVGAVAGFVGFLWSWRAKRND